MPDVWYYPEVSDLTSGPVYWKKTELCSSKQKEEKSLAKAEERLGLKKHHLQISHYYEVT